MLDLIYSAERPDTADLAHSILQDLLDLVSRSHGAPGTLLEGLGEIRGECEDRLERIDAELIWDQSDELPDPQRIMASRCPCSASCAKPSATRSGMRSRAAELTGTTRCDPGTHGGTKVLLRMPLG